jgi:hypothetical protein
MGREDAIDAGAHDPLRATAAETGGEFAFWGVLVGVRLEPGDPLEADSSSTVMTWIWMLSLGRTPKAMWGGAVVSHHGAAVHAHFLTTYQLFWMS